MTLTTPPSRALQSKCKHPSSLNSHTFVYTLNCSTAHDGALQARLLSLLNMSRTHCGDFTRGDEKHRQANGHHILLYLNPILTPRMCQCMQFSANAVCSQLSLCQCCSRLLVQCDVVQVKVQLEDLAPHRRVITCSHIALREPTQDKTGQDRTEKDGS